jgi:hypothetical protein
MDLQNFKSYPVYNDTRGAPTSSVSADSASAKRKTLGQLALDDASDSSNNAYRSTPQYQPSLTAHPQQCTNIRQSSTTSTSSSSANSGTARHKASSQFATARASDNSSHAHQSTYQSTSYSAQDRFPASESDRQYSGTTSPNDSGSGSGGPSYQSSPSDDFGANTAFSTVATLLLGWAARKAFKAFTGI